MRTGGISKQTFADKVSKRDMYKAWEYDEQQENTEQL